MSGMIERIRAAVAASPRPMLTGKEVSQTIGDVIALLDGEGLLHEGEDLIGEIVRLTITELSKPNLEVMTAAYNAEPIPSMRASIPHYYAAWRAGLKEALR
jgi:hypothetical protein